MRALAAAHATQVLAEVRATQAPVVARVATLASAPRRAVTAAFASPHRTAIVAGLRGASVPS